MRRENLVGRCGVNASLVGLRYMAGFESRLLARREQQSAENLN